MNSKCHPVESQCPRLVPRKPQPVPSSRCRPLVQHECGLPASRRFRAARQMIQNERVVAGSVCAASAARRSKLWFSEPQLFNRVAVHRPQQDAASARADPVVGLTRTTGHSRADLSKAQTIPDTDWFKPRSLGRAHSANVQVPDGKPRSVMNARRRRRPWMPAARSLNSKNGSHRAQ